MAYGTDTEFQAWLSGQGLTLPAGANAATLRAVGSAYVDAAYGHRLNCSSRTGGFNQPLAWPRTGHHVNGRAVPDDLIPQAWVHAAYRAAYLNATNPGWATGSVNPNRITKREKVSDIEREFFAAGENGQANAAPGMNVDGMIEGLVASWLCSTSRTLSNLFMVI